MKFIIGDRVRIRGTLIIGDITDIEGPNYVGKLTHKIRLISGRSKWVTEEDIEFKDINSDPNNEHNERNKHITYI